MSRNRFTIAASLCGLIVMTTTVSAKHHSDGNNSGGIRSTQTVERDARGMALAKTVTVKQPAVLTGRTAFGDKQIVKNYDHGRYGFVYHPDRAQRAPLMAFHRDPFWHNPAGGFQHHQFHYMWQWDRYPWYRSRVDQALAEAVANKELFNSEMK
jgi:hypothetical protein